MKTITHITLLITLLFLSVGSHAADTFVPDEPGKHVLSQNVTIQIELNSEGKKVMTLTAPSVKQNSPGELNTASFIFQGAPETKRLLYWDSSTRVLWWTDLDSVYASDSKKYAFPTEVRKQTKVLTDKDAPKALKEKLAEQTH